MSIEFFARSRIGDLDLDAAFESDGRLTALFGPSGAGKSTIVNIIAGLVRPRQGRVVVDGTVLLDTDKGIAVPVHKRRIGYVFQEARLFPHLSVRQNLLYGRLFGRAEGGGGGLDEVADMLGLDGLLTRGVAKLSGGERQRVAIGRALLSSPRLLLLDEPLSSLDDARKREVMPYLERVRDEAKVPIVYVSHAMAEVARLATSLVLVAEGRVSAAGETAEILSRTDLAVSEEAETGAVIEGRVSGHDRESGLTTIATPSGELRVPLLDRPAGSRLRARIRARDVIVAVEAPRGLSALNILAGTVAEIGPAHGASVELAIDCGGVRLVARITTYSLKALGLAPGMAVYAVVKTVSFDAETTGGAPAGSAAL